MASFESIKRKASVRLRDSRAEQREVVKKVRQGRPLDAEDDDDRKVAYIRRVLNVDSKIAKRVAAYDDPARLPLTPLQRSKAESLQGTTVDFMPLRRYLDLAIAASRAVGRIILTDGTPDGTGFLVSPTLLLTNHHVIPDQATARDRLVEFSYEIGEAGTTLATSQFRLNPDLFVTDPEDDLDFTLIGVGELVRGTGDLPSFGFLPLIGTGDKHIKGAFVNVIQHPSGGLKQLVHRENRILHRGHTTLIYGADTLRGSSGSPVFNDEWEVVALHHYGSPFRAHKDPDADVPEEGNEGVRISSIVEHLKAEMPRMNGPLREAVRQALTPPSRTVPLVPTGGGVRGNGRGERRDTDMAGEGPRGENGRATLRLDPDGGVTWTIPLGPARPKVTVDDDTTTLRLGEETRDGESATKTFRPDPDYGTRKGYNKSFLGVVVPLPTLSSALANAAAKVDGGGRELKYQHFSVVMHATRKLAIFTAVNVDGASVVRIDRDSGRVKSVEGESAGAEGYERWYADPRIDAALVTDQSLYDSAGMSRFHRGHLVKRTDPSWGNRERGIRGQADTFHFTNCTPQHERFNPVKSRWAGVEDWITNGSDHDDLRVTVFSGPIFRDKDPKISGIKVPRAYWKVIVRVDDGQLLATGIIADQSKLIGGGGGESLEGDGAEDLPAFPDRLPDEYQVTIAEIEKRTGLKFGTLRKHDTFADGGGGESLGQRRIVDFDDLELGGRFEARARSDATLEAAPAEPADARLSPGEGPIMADTLETSTKIVERALSRAFAIPLPSKNAKLEDLIPGYPSDEAKNRLRSILGQALQQDNLESAPLLTLHEYSTVGDVVMQISGTIPPAVYECPMGHYYFTNWGTCPDHAGMVLTPV